MNFLKPSQEKINEANNKKGEIYKDIQNSRYYYNDKGEIHRENDLPAIVTPKGKFWYQNGKLHRADNKPAIVYNNGKKAWFINGVQTNDRMSSFYSKK